MILLNQVDSSISIIVPKPIVMTQTSLEGHRVLEPALSSLASTPAVFRGAPREVFPPPPSAMGVDYVSLLARAEIMVSNYEVTTKSKLSDQAAEKMKSIFFDRLVE